MVGINDREAEPAASGPATLVLPVPRYPISVTTMACR